MLFQLDGCAPHEEDTWDGFVFRIGAAAVRVGGPVDRCAVTTRDPDTGERDLDTLRLLKEYRGQRESDGAVVFGVYATEWGLIFASVVIAALPVVVLYLMMTKRFIAGLTAGSVKG